VNTMSNIIYAFATAALILVGNGASFGSEYLQRTDTITLGAGNANDVNAAIHVIDPWPRHVGNVRIRGDGDRMVGAVQRYKRGASQRPASPGGAVGGVTTNEAGGLSAPSSTSSAPVPAGAPSLRD
jgi:hypothetical protein